MITLSIRGESLMVTEGASGCCWRQFVVYAQVDSRPDPIHRAWNHLEVKWAMEGKP